MSYSQHKFLEAIRMKSSDPKTSAAMLRSYCRGLNELKTGDIVEFGRHRLTEMIKPISDGAAERPITWEIIDKQEDRLLLLSEYILDWEMFDEGGEEWENSELRDLLIYDYCIDWFSEAERSLLCIRPDRVFLLSVEQAKAYFGDSGRGRAEMLYAEYEATETGEGDLAPCIEKISCEWWLRTPGTDVGTAFVAIDGEIVEEGYDSDADEFGVRPAIWLDLKKLREMSGE